MNSKATIAIIDYGMGNLFSIYHALVAAGGNVVIADNPSTIGQADALILPGVGAFADAMQNLQEKELVESIFAFIDSGKSFLGICLGMQLLFDSSEEFGLTKGLGLISGKVEHLSKDSALPIRVPHIGWSPLHPRVTHNQWSESLLSGIPEGEPFYFIHSFKCIPTDFSCVLAEAHYENQKIVAGIKHNNIEALQFHPEKSGEFGIHILRNFIKKIHAE